MQKNTYTEFWKTWRAKVSQKTKQVSVNGSCEPADIAESFARFFWDIGNSVIGPQDIGLSERADGLRRERYVHGSEEDLHNFSLLEELDITIVSYVIGQLVKRKAPGPDGITGEHIIHSHPVLASILLRLFKWILRTGFVPSCFSVSYMVPISKNKDKASGVLTCEDFRGISISSILSKLFESCVFVLCEDLFATSDNQFGFKHGIGCSQAVHVAKEYIEAYNRGGDTAYIAALDVIKAFPRVNHDAVIIKLHERNFPAPIIELIDNWFDHSVFSVKWIGCVSASFTLRTGVNQGSVLAPFIFALLIDDVIRSCSNWKRFDKGVILVYADDILLITRTRMYLQEFVLCVQLGLGLVNLHLNAVKCSFMRIGPCFDAPCAPISCIDESIIAEVAELRYLGVYLVSSRAFRVSMDVAKRSFSRSTNGILSRLQGTATEDVILHLISTKTMPVLLYANEATSLKKSVVSSLDFCVVRFVMKILKTSNRDLVMSCLDYFGFKLPSQLIAMRQCKFNKSFITLDNSVCKLVRGFKP